MAYIGPPPSQKLATPTSQYFSGNGSATAFTLNRPVNVAEDLNVFVNNVAQQPGSGKSYTATGTTLTFDAAPDAGTNNVYVVYRGLSEGTLRLEQDPNSGITATTGTFSGDLTVDTTTLKVDSTNNRVGIGTASPLSGLSVESSTGGVFTLSTSDTTGTSGDTLGQIDFYSGDVSTGSTGVQARISGVYDSNGDSAAITFTTGTSTGSGSPTIAEHLRITSTGKVETSNRDFGFFNHGTNVTLADDASIVINGTVAGCGLLALYDTASGTNGLYRIGYGSCAGLSAQGAVGQATANTDGSICVFSSGHTITIKNRTGITRGFTLAMFMAGNNFAG